LRHARQKGQNYCGNCGAALVTASAAGLPGAKLGSADAGAGSADAGAGSAGASASSVSVGPAMADFGAPVGAQPRPGDDVRYPREAVIGAVLLTIIMPFIALIAALGLRAQEMQPIRREQLKNWAVASVAWLATGWVIGIILFTSALSAFSPSGCKGGIDLTVPPSYESSDGKHWVGTFTCMNGGTITKLVPASQVPGGS